MKRIGILTFHWENNYGAVLQAYSLSKYISSLGHEVEIINFVPLDLKYATQLLPISYSYLKSFGYLKFFKRAVYSMFKWNLVWINRINEFDRFRKKYLKKTSFLYLENAFVNKANEFDFVVVGSDQVWNLEIISDYSDFYFLTFEGISVSRISYSASFGLDIDSLNDNQKAYVITALSRFSYISVRENNAKLKLDYAGLGNLLVHLDPIFLTDKSSYDCLINRNKIEKIILVYDLQPIGNLTTLIEAINVDSLKVYYFNPVKKYSKVYINYYSEGPLVFLDLLNRAEIVVTNSFHGLAFSIHYEKQFYVVLPPIRENRLVELLNLTNLMDRIIDTSRPLVFNTRIDYSRVRKVIQSKIDDAKNYLDQVFK